MNANTLPPGAKHIAACHSAASCSAFGSFVMYLPAPRTLKDAGPTSWRSRNYPAITPRHKPAKS